MIVCGKIISPMRKNSVGEGGQDCTVDATDGEEQRQTLIR